MWEEQCLTNAARSPEQTDTKTEHLAHTIERNKFKVDQWPQCKS